MGGRGASSGTGKGIAKELVMDSKTQSLEMFLSKLGLDSVVSGEVDDKLRSNSEVRRQKSKQRFERKIEKAIDDYHTKRDEAINQYNELVSKGKIKKPTSLQLHYQIAQGNSDNQSTQAARRLLAKKGYDWQTGKKISK